MTDHEHDLNGESRLTRRESLIRFAGAAALVGGAGAWRLASADAAA
jgi:hypothetical protein